MEGFDPFIKLCRDVIAPLIATDGGRVYLVRATRQELVLHLSGRCSGCPGFCCTVSTLIEPCAHAINPDVRVVVTHGALLPPNAVRIETDTIVESEHDELDVGVEPFEHGNGGVGTVEAEVRGVLGADGEVDVREGLASEQREESAKVTRQHRRRRRRGGRRRLTDDSTDGEYEVSE